MMKRSYTYALLVLMSSLLCAVGLQAQTILRGMVYDAATNEPLIGAGVILEGTTTGVVSDWDGSFDFTVDQPLPLNLEVSYVGYETRIVEVTSTAKLDISLEESSVTIEGVEVKASRISDKQKESPLTIEAMDFIAIKETPAADFYDGLGSLKGVDLTAASLGFKVVNTRGFNSTSPVRSLQIIDGVDNQAPGLNFSLGNFLGSSELDVNKVELIVGASSAFYGPNAFNGVISMETKDPFYKTGLSATVRAAERNFLKGAVRYADAFKNKNGDKFMAFKVNMEYFRADDWEAENYDPITDSDVGADNPGGFDAVNIYGDESSFGSSTPVVLEGDFKGLGQYHRTGYREIDLVDYDTENFKANFGLNFRVQPKKAEQSPEIKIGTNYGSGTTVYQGDNRFSLRGITFLQNTLEFSKRNKYFVRAYTTRTGAGDSYDPYFTALELLQRSKNDFNWNSAYQDYWNDNISSLFEENGYVQPEGVFDPVLGEVVTPQGQIDAARQWLLDNQNLLTDWHNQSRVYADTFRGVTNTLVPFFQPGTDRFDQEFNDIISTYRSEGEINPITGQFERFGGTRFYDNSALYHIHGEYIFTPEWTDKITVGTSGRIYAPDSRGTVFSDTSGVSITNREFGLYTGVEKSLYDNKVKLQATFRTDKNENFDWLFSPAASIVYTPSPNNFFRVSFSSAIRNPTLSDQYLFLDVGRAILSGNLNGVQGLYTIESFQDAFGSSVANAGLLETFDIAPVQPERVQTFEVGARTTLFEKVYLDAGYYYSIYNDFLGFNLGLDATLDSEGNPIAVQAYRYAANSQNRVTTQGFSIGANYYFWDGYAINGNYSWNKLVTTVEDDPIIPAFNTPEHKFNLGVSGRNLKFGNLKGIGFNVNYKWVEGFIFEGSPQFTGFVPTYDMLDAQVNYLVSKIDTTIKIGASNLLDNRQFQTYGGPRIGRMAYIQLTYEPNR